MLEQHEGMHVISMEEFLEKEALPGYLHNKFPPSNSSHAFGPKLWRYLTNVADVTPAWGGKYVAFPEHMGDFDLNDPLKHNLTELKQRKFEFGGDKTVEYYDEKLQQAHHIHFSSDPDHRVLQHHYGKCNTHIYYSLHILCE